MNDYGQVVYAITQILESDLLKEQQKLVLLQLQRELLTEWGRGLS